MNRALLELHLRSLRGLVIRRLRLLRQPRYAVGLVAGLLWITFWAGRPLLRLLGRMGRGGDGTLELGERTVRIGDGSVHFGAGALLGALPPDALAGIHLLLAALVTVLLCLWWVLPWYRPVLRLKEEELSLLLSAPLTRRQIIQYALLRNQPGILFGCLILSVFLGFGPLPRRLSFFLVAWVFLSLWDLHSTARHIWQARTRERGGAAGLRRRLLVGGALLAYLAAVLVVAYAGHRHALAVAAASGHEKLQLFSTYLAALGGWRPAVLLLAPAWLVTWSFFATGATAYVLGLAAPLLALAAHHEWVVRTPTLFEDAALEHARRRGRVRAAGGRRRRRGQRLRRSQPFPLAPRGWPEVAIVWKNQMQVSRMSLGTMGLLALAAVLLVAVAPGFFPLAVRLYASAGILGLAFVFFQPLMCGVMYRHDLRVDLLHADILRAWPLTGGRLVAAEMAGPVLWATLGAMLGFAVAVAAALGYSLHGLAGDGQGGIVLPGPLGEMIGTRSLLTPFLALLAVLPLVVALATVSAGVQNLAVLMFPGWVRLGKQRRSGAAHFGQNLLVTFVLMVSTLVGLVPGVLLLGAAVGLHILLGAGVPAWEWPFLGLLTALPLAAEGAGLVLLAGRRWERFDPSAQTLSED